MQLTAGKWALEGIGCSIAEVGKLRVLKPLLSNLRTQQQLPLGHPHNLISGGQQQWITRQEVEQCQLRVCGGIHNPKPSQHLEKRLARIKATQIGSAAAMGTPSVVANVVLGAFWARPKNQILKKLVGAGGFEVITYCSQSTRATKLRHAPLFFNNRSVQTSTGIQLRQKLVSETQLQHQRLLTSFS